MYGIDMIVQEWQSNTVNEAEVSRTRSKRPTTLNLSSDDLNNNSSRAKRLKNQLAVTILPSPEFERLVLASPEFEHFLKGALGVISPVESTLVTSEACASHEATDEQKQFVKGFEEALEQCKRRHVRDMVPAQMSALNVPSTSATTLATLTATARQESVAIQHTRNAAPSQLSAEPHNLDKLDSSLKSAANSTMNNTDLSLIAENDLTEEAKLQRKRLRNRLAASKCRKKKLERIFLLEQEVHALKIEKSEYLNKINILGDEITQLRQKLATHNQNNRYTEL